MYVMKTPYRHVPHSHQPKNVNEVHAQGQLSLNDKIAVFITRIVSTMQTTYIFAILAIIGFPGFNATPTQYVQWVSQTFIQLVALSVLAVGQQVLSKQGELMAQEQYHATINSYHDIEQIMQHLCAQDAELLRHAKMLEHLLEKNGISLQQLETEGASTSLLDSYVQPRSAGGAPAAPASPAGEKPNA